MYNALYAPVRKSKQSKPDILDNTIFHPKLKNIDMHMINKRVPTGRTGVGLHFPYNHMYMYLKKILGPPPPPIPRPPHFFSGNTKRI